MPFKFQDVLSPQMAASEVIDVQQLPNIQIEDYYTLINVRPTSLNTANGLSVHKKINFICNGITKRGCYQQSLANNMGSSYHQ